MEGRLEEERRWIEEATREYSEQFNILDPVASTCEHVSFVSRTRGYSRGRDYPRRKKPKRRPERGGLEIELLGYSGRFYQINQTRDGKGPVDEIAIEVLGNTVPLEDAEQEFLKQLRNLNRR